MSRTLSVLLIVCKTAKAKKLTSISAFFYDGICDRICARGGTMPSGKKKKRHKIATHKRKKRLKANRHKKKKR